MARETSKAKPAAPKAGKSSAAADGRTPKLDKKLIRSMEKRLKKLGGQLEAATRRERECVRALDKAHRRRQVIDSAIDEIRSSTVVPAATAAVAPVAPVVTAAAPASAAAPRPAVKPAAPKPATRATATRAAAKPATRAAAKPATRAAAAKPAATAKPATARAPRRAAPKPATPES